MSRPTLLFLCQNLPFPPDGGALIRSYHTLRILSRDFDVTALCFHREATRSSRQAVKVGIAGLARLADVQSFPIPQDGSPGRFVWDHLRSLASGRAYTRWVYDSRNVRGLLADLFDRKHFDLVHLDSLDLVAYAEDLPQIPTVCAHHNVESQLLRRRAEAERGMRRRYIQYQAHLTELEERRWCARFDLNVVVSAEDRASLEAISPSGRYLVVPNGVDTSSFRPAPPNLDRSGIVFVGGHTWFPNRDGMEYFAREVLPLLRSRLPRLKVTWVGRAADEVRDQFARVGIEMTGYVESIVPWVHRAACFVVPLRVGGGTRLKILDAWALGTAVVSTSQGAEGLRVENGRNMILADNPEAFADAVMRVLGSETLRRRLERGGRATAEDCYDWKVIGDTMLPHYHDLVDS